MKPKVLILLDTHVVNGPAKGLFQFLEHADHSRFEYAVGCFDYRGAHRRDFIEAVREHELPLLMLPQQFRFDPRPIQRCISAVRREGFTHVESHGYKSHLIAAITKLATGCRWIAFSHGWTAENLKVKLYQFLDRVVLRFADISVGVAPSIEAVLRKISSGGRIELVLNAVDRPAPAGADDRSKIRALFGISADAPVIGCFGRMSTEKGQAVLLSALSRLSAADRPHLILLGEGVDRKQLEAQVHAAGLSEKVHFAGYQRNVSGYYAAIDLLVLPSLSEGMPNVVLEAMSYGIPVLSTDVGAVRDAIHDGLTGWLVPPGNPEALSTQLAKCLSDPAELRRVGEAGRTSLYPKFDPAARAAEILRLYESAG